MNMPRIGWKSLRSMGTSKILRSSYWWIMTVPIAAKVIAQIQQQQINLMGVKIPVPLSLPFSWCYFYWASLAFSGASLIFSIRCPTLISEFADGHAFLSRGGHTSEMRNQIRKYLTEVEKCPELSIDGNTFKAREEQLRKIILKHMVKPAHPVDIDDPFESFHFTEGAIMDAYADATLAYDHIRPWSRFFCVILYGCGFALLGWILLRNTMFVWSFWVNASF